ncbi:MAG TPA: S49 family peptidase [Gammaproteobacteria bacterium]|nr:S49 family peptidase [Gammaproteobacteria bacterium]
MFDKDAASGNSRESNDDWNRDLVNRLAFAAVDEQRRARRWGIFFKFLMAGYLLLLLFLYMPTDWSDLSKVSEKHTALVDFKGIITDSSEASADKIITGLRAAFEDEGTSGVILRANSPGGSPVQSAYIYDEIKRLRELYPDTPLYAVVTDMCASGCYYVASAADDIYVDKSSIIGSIGVRMDSFGFVDTMEKLGVERRLYTAGKSKGFLDPFTPSKPADVEHVKVLLESIHKQFINSVKTGRGDRLKDEPKLFTGLVWTGEESLSMGLADEIGSSGYVAREIIGEAEIVEFTEKPDLLERLSERIGVAMAKGMGELLMTGTGAVH